MLTTHHFLFTAEIMTPLELDDHSGAALRGNLFEAIWKRFCTNKSSPSCAECPLHTICPVSAIVAPLREENQRGRDIPRPYIILPPLGDARTYERGERFLFGITLFGSIIQLLPYIVMSMSQMEESGLGRKQAENNGQRGRFRITQIDTIHPFSAERRCIYQSKQTLVQTPTISLTHSDIQTRAAGLSTERITLDFLTPTRLIDQERLVRDLTFRTLTLRISERLTNLQKTYGELSEEEEQRNQKARSKLIQLASQIECVRDETQWKEVQSYSRRQHRFTPVSGLMGQITFAGDITPFRELLTWGELIHIGKSAVKGNGWYKIIE